MRAGFFERLGLHLRSSSGGTAILAVRHHTPLQLGPYRWRARLAQKRKEGESAPTSSTIDTPPVHGTGVGAVALCVGEPVDVASIKDAALAAGATVNDFLMTALAAGLRQYLESKKQLPLRSKTLKLTAVAVINPRSAMPQDIGSGSSQSLLRDYESMRGAGCDITLAMLPLPCGDMPPAARLSAVKSLTRRTKLSPYPLVLRFGANVLVRLFGVRCLIALYTVIISKFTTYVSNVVAPPIKGAFCGATIKDIWFGTTPLDFGVSFSWLSYAGRNRLCCVADALTVPDPEVMARWCVTTYLRS